MVDPVFRSSPEDAEVDKGHNDYVEPPDEDVEETGHLAPSFFEKVQIGRSGGPEF